ncbi:asparaginyl-tRNA synthetase [Panus rudis PR-1116 ss-1]|nr:asparaginyl-tRNA synthetase [Panus rudis PR-1116 ss-1]
MRAAWRLTPFGNLGCSRSLFRRFASTSTLPPTIRQLLQTDVSNQPTRVEVNGWVKSVRKQKKIAFAAITDGSSQQPLQAVFTNVELAKSLTNGACVRLQGVLSASPGRGQDKEIQVDAVECLGECDPNDYPIQKQDLSVEYLRDHCHLRARTPRMASMLRLRDQTQQALHDHFKTEDFTYVHTPILTANDCEGAGETFRIAPSSHTTSPDQRAADTEEEFFGRAAYLTVSSQLHLEALATSISRVYTLSPCFRAERSQTGRHLSEFWMLEAEWAFTRNVSDVCRVVEGAVKSALQQRSEDLGFLRQSLDDSRRSFLEDTANSQKPWDMVSYGDAVKELEKYQAATRKFHYEPKWGEPLHSEHERWVSEQLVKGPVFVTDYPSSLKPFYMRINEDGRTVACFDLLVPYLGELVGGSLREERHDVLLKNLKTHNLDPEEFSWYLDLRKYGGAPHGGFGLGFDRLIQWISGIENIRECIPMPRYAGRMLL